MPKPLFAKLVAVAAIGFLCLLGGSVYGLSTEDRILLMLSILIGACSLILLCPLRNMCKKRAFPF